MDELTEDDVLDLAASFRIARAIYAAAQLGIAEALIEPMSAEQIARRVGADPVATRELVRALASRGVFGEPSSGTFTRTLASRALLPAAEGGSKEVVLGWIGHPAVYRGLERLDDGVRTGRPAFELTHARGFFDWLGSHPDELDSYASSVGGEDPEEFRSLLDVIDLSGYTVLGDVGGGGGALLRCAAERYEHLRGIVVELPAVASRTTALIAETTVADRVTVVAADARLEIPTGPDCYIMSTVLRYFNDMAALDVLRRIHAALPAGGAVILVEMPQSPGPAKAPHAMKSLVELALSGGRDRTFDEYQDLLEAAGFTAVAARCWQEPYWIINATASR